MEIGQYLRARPWSVAIALLFPILAGLTAYALLQGPPTRYSASASVPVPESVGGSASIGIFAADFSLAAERERILEPIAEKNGVTVGGLRNNLDVERLGQSSRLTVSYSNRNEDKVEPVLRDFITATLVELTSDEASVANLKAAQAAAAKAQSALRTFQNENSLDPQRDYNQYSSAVIDLQEEGITSGPQYNAAVARRDRQVEVVRQYESLLAADEAAQDALRDAQSAARSSQAAATAARNPAVIEDLTVEEISQTSRVVQGTAVAAILGALVGLALLVLPDLLRGGRRRTPPQADAPARHLA